MNLKKTVLKTRSLKNSIPCSLTLVSFKPYLYFAALKVQALFENCVDYKFAINLIFKLSYGLCLRIILYIFIIQVP